MRKVGLEPTCIYALPLKIARLPNFATFALKKQRFSYDTFCLERTVCRCGVFFHSFQTVPRIWSRRSVILPQFIDEKVFIHNGKTFISLVITEEMVGHKFGEFAMTRKRAIHKKKVKKKK